MALFAGESPKRPANILFIVSDEFRHDCLGVAGHPIVKTPKGRTLAPLMRGEGPGPEAAYAYLADKMVRQRDWKLIEPLGRSKSGVRELYNVVRDPEEQSNLYDRTDAAVAQKKLLALMETRERNQSPPPVILPSGK